MTYYTMVVVLDAPDAGDAWNAMSEATQHSRFADEVQFISTPWEVKPANADALAASDLYDEHEDARLLSVAEFSPEFDTFACFDQHPEKPVR